MSKEEKKFTPADLAEIKKLPTYQPGNTPYDKYTEKPAPPAEKPKGQ